MMLDLDKYREADPEPPSPFYFDERSAFSSRRASVNRDGRQRKASSRLRHWEAKAALERKGVR